MNARASVRASCGTSFISMGNERTGKPSSRSGSGAYLPNLSANRPPSNSTCTFMTRSFPINVSNVANALRAIRRRPSRPNKTRRERAGATSPSRPRALSVQARFPRKPHRPRRAFSRNPFQPTSAGAPFAQAILSPQCSMRRATAAALAAGSLENLRFSREACHRPPHSL